MSYDEELLADEENEVAEENNERSCCLSIGVYLAVQKIIKETSIRRFIDGMYNDDRGSGLFLDLVSCILLNEYYGRLSYQDYAYRHLLFSPGQKYYPDELIARFMSEISEESCESFIYEWNDRKNHREKIYIKCNAAGENVNSGDIRFVEYDQIEQYKRIPHTCLSLAFDQKHSEPLFYKEYPGNIIDESKLQLLLEEAKGCDYHHASFIFDKGRITPQTLDFLDNNRYGFIIKLDGRNSLIRDVVQSVKSSFEDKYECRIRGYYLFGTTIQTKVFPSDHKERYLHIFHNDEMQADERIKSDHFFNNIEDYFEMMKGRKITLPKEFTKYYDLRYDKGEDGWRFSSAVPKDDEINRVFGSCGYFCIVSSEEMTAKDALDVYMQSGVPEELFSSDESIFLDSIARMKVEETYEGERLIQFIALIVRNRIQEVLDTADQISNTFPNRISVNDAFRELEKIEVVCQKDGTYELAHELTGKQNTLLEALNISEKQFDKELKSIKNAAR